VAQAQALVDQVLRQRSLALAQRDGVVLVGELHLGGELQEA